jgi:4,5-DOPA dioxygenase extradiol
MMAAGSSFDGVSKDNKVWPVIFVGHGTPLNALMDNVFTDAWARLGAALGRPRAILSISGHWYTRGTRVTAMERPSTLYDFGYQNMFHIKYPAPGSPALGDRIVELLNHVSVIKDYSWGFDHGTWSVLSKAYPAADIPVIQLSLDRTREPEFHYELGRQLKRLRREEVLIMGSGNIVHNLELTTRTGKAQPHAWAERFDSLVRSKLIDRDFDALVDYQSLSPDAALAVPTPDHYLPLLYTLGAAEPDDLILFPVEEIDRGSMSMRTIVFGSL